MPQYYLKGQSGYQNIHFQIDSIPLNTASIQTFAEQIPSFIDQNVSQSDSFGYSFDYDPNVLVIGAPDQESVYVYHIDDTINGPVATEITILTGGNLAQSGEKFGTSVTVSYQRIIVGAPYRNNGQGAVYVFTFQQGSWILDLEKILTPPDGTTETTGHYGLSVKLTDLTLVVGAPNAYGYGSTNRYGAAYVYTTHNGSRLYTYRSKLLPSYQIANTGFGKAISIDRESYIAIGAPNESLVYDQTYTNAGSVYLFGKTGVNWYSLTKLIYQNGITNHYFGISVSMVNGRLIIGGPGNNGVYYYTGHADAWALNTTLTVTSDSSGTIEDSVIIASDNLGFCIDQDFERNLIMASAPNYNGGQGAIFVFEMPTPGATWKAASTSKLQPSDVTSSDHFGKLFTSKDKQLIASRNFTNGLAYWEGNKNLQNWEG